MVCQKGTPLPVVRIGLLIGAGLGVMVCRTGAPLLVVRAVLPAFLRHMIVTFGWLSYGFFEFDPVAATVQIRRGVLSLQLPCNG
jgi:hypothetical protein